MNLSNICLKVLTAGAMISIIDRTELKVWKRVWFTMGWLALCLDINWSSLLYSRFQSGFRWCQTQHPQVDLRHQSIDSKQILLIHHHLSSSLRFPL